MGRPLRSLADLSGWAEARSVCGRSGQAGVHSRDRRAAEAAGHPTLDDKVVQRTAVEVLNAIYETDFLGFSSSGRGAARIMLFGCALRRAPDADGELGTQC